MWIECFEFNFKLLIILIFPAFRRLEDFTKPLYITKENTLFKTFRYFLCHIFAAVILLISYKKDEKGIIIPLEISRENTEKNPTLSFNSFMINEIDELKQKNIKKRKIKSTIFLLILSANGLLCYLYRLFFNYADKYFEFGKQSIGIFFDIGFYIFFSYFILKQKLYKHNLVSLLIIVITIFILAIITFVRIRDLNQIIISFGYYFFYSLLFCLYDVLGKKYMIYFYNTPYFMMFIIGIINIFLLLVFDIFAYFFNREISGIIIGFKNNITSALNFFEFILDLIVEFIWNLGIWLTVYYFTPCHFFISEYISEFIYYIINAFNSDDNFYSIINIIIFSIASLINIFCSLIYNEVIILNFLGLDYNTKKRIQERMKIDDEALTDESYEKQASESGDDTTTN